MSPQRRQKERSYKRVPKEARPKLIFAILPTLDGCKAAANANKTWLLHQCPKLVTTIALKYTKDLNMEEFGKVLFSCWFMKKDSMVFQENLSSANTCDMCLNSASLRCYAANHNLSSTRPITSLKQRVHTSGDLKVTLAVCCGCSPLLLQRKKDIQSLITLNWTWKHLTKELQNIAEKLEGGKEEGVERKSIPQYQFYA